MHVHVVQFHFLIKKVLKSFKALLLSQHLMSYLQNRLKLRATSWGPGRNA